MSPKASGRLTFAFMTVAGCGTFGGISILLARWLLPPPGDADRFFSSVLWLLCSSARSICSECLGMIGGFFLVVGTLCLLMGLTDDNTRESLTPSAVLMWEGVCLLFGLLWSLACVVWAVFATPYRYARFRMKRGKQSRLEL